MANERQNSEEIERTTELVELFEECRAIVPGAEALLGIQILASLQSGFAALPLIFRILHLGALVALSISLACAATPSILARRTRLRRSPTSIRSEAFLEESNRLLAVSFVALAIGVALDVLVVAAVVSGPSLGGALVGCYVLLMFIATWFIFPRLLLRHLRPSAAVRSVERRVYVLHAGGKRGLEGKVRPRKS